MSWPKQELTLVRIKLTAEEQLSHQWQRVNRSLLTLSCLQQVGEVRAPLLDFMISLSKTLQKILGVSYGCFNQNLIMQSFAASLSCSSSSLAHDELDVPTPSNSFRKRGWSDGFFSVVSGIKSAPPLLWCLSVRVFGKFQKFLVIFRICLNCWCFAAKRIAHVMTNGPNFKIWLGKWTK